MPRLLLTSSSPRIAGLRGTLTIEPIGVERVAELLSTRTRDTVSLLTFQSTCDVLAALAGLRGVHRHRPDRDTVDLTLQPGDQTLVITLRDQAKGKAPEAMGAIDFQYTLCEFQP